MLTSRVASEQILCPRIPPDAPSSSCPHKRRRDSDTGADHQSPPHPATRSSDRSDGTFRARLSPPPPTATPGHDVVAHQGTDEARADPANLGSAGHEPQDVQDKACGQDRSHDGETSTQGVAHDQGVEQIEGQVKTPRKCSEDKPGYERTRLPAVTTAVAGGTRVPQYPGST